MVDESIKDVITEADVRDVPIGEQLLIREGAIITPSARELAEDNDVFITAE